MSGGIQRWVGIPSKAGEPAIGVTAILVGCHVGPYPVGKHSPVWSYAEVGLGYWKLVACGAIGWRYMHAQQVQKADHRIPDVGLVLDSCIRSEE